MVLKVLLSAAAASAVALTATASESASPAMRMNRPIPLKSPEKVFLAVVISATVATGAQGQSSADSAAIRQAALDYVQGWYAGDGAQMERAVHPELAKRIVQTDARGRSRLMQQSALTLINGTRMAEGRQTPPDQRIRNIRILDIFGNSASVRAEMSGWVDYMHVAKWNGQWKIVNVLWELKNH